MPEQLVSRRTTYGWLSLLSAMTLAQSAADDVDNLVVLCPLPVGILDLAARRLIVMSPALAELLEVDSGATEVDLDVMVQQPPTLEDLFELVRGGTIDVYSVRRRLRRRRSGPVEVESWVAVTGVEVRNRALWVVVPAGEDAGLPTAAPTAETWPHSISGLVVGSFDAEWRIQRVSVDVERVLGHSVEEMVGRRVIEEVHPEDLPRLFAAAAQCLVDLAGVGVSLSWRHRSGDWVQLQCIITRLGDDGLTFGFACSSKAAGGDVGAGRAAALERHLWRIAREVEMSGVVSGFSRVPDPKEIPGLSELSARQWEVLTGLLRGERVPAIARALFVSQSTVRNHLTDMFRKLGVHSQAELLDLLRSDDRGAARKRSRANRTDR
ncbi:MAG: PAS domain-containing protein [Acidobacteriota bacterium]|nr:PAS domain-containing protein [Acidobacteriota bacterium]